VRLALTLGGLAAALLYFLLGLLCGFTLQDCRRS
jgi:hypothetical protein